ncbi:GlxA family transcriptional regulator [Sphaerisporangium corydalis]|uniref:GlxA family transcriptional regulator n=1 Tax=Sphaerisporangium corydalis TaxID=1441875 RepID=A0ABV9ECM7_9ACTN|nr:helix-turn-helix domain-containing protein [Sphaerisporangium corydalis]
MTGITQLRRSDVGRCHPEKRHRPPNRPSAAASGGPFRVVVFATEGVSSFALGAVSQVFADRSHLGLPRFSLTVCAGEGGALRTDLGLLLSVEHGPEAMRTADLIIMLPTEARPLTVRRPVVDAIGDAFRRGTIVAAYGTGSFLLAETGLLDGRRAATDWALAGRLAERHPRITVDPVALYVDEGRIVTGAGAAAGIDMCLHLLRRELGPAVSDAVAREAMVAARRASGQVQYVPAPWSVGGARRAGFRDPRLDEVLLWARTRLREAMSVDDLARRALMSPRTFARRFREATGTTPRTWLRDQRLDRAEELLETTDLPIQKIADLVGMGSDGVLRDHFVKRHGIPPRDWRRDSTRR